MLSVTQPKLARVAPAGRLFVATVLLAPAGMLIGLGLASGGFFPDATAVAAVAVILLLAVRAVTSRRALAGIGPAAGLVAAGLIGFAIWTLVSGSWSGAAARAAFEYDRTLLYIAVFAVTAAIGRSVLSARTLLYGLTAVSIAISAAAVATWLLPDVFPVGAAVGRTRLSWPTSYWNATGLIAALAVVWSVSLSCSSRERAGVRVVAAAGAPVAAAMLIFTVSRGAVAVAALGVLVAIAAIRSSATPGGIAALAPALALAVAIALRVTGLNVDRPSAHAISAGHRTAVVLALVAVGAAALRAALLLLDKRLIAARPPTGRRARATLAIACAVLAVLFVTLGGPHAVRDAVHKFVAPATDSVNANLPASVRLTRFGSNGRLAVWRVAWRDGFLRHPVDGIGAGTYATLWTRHGSTFRRVLDAHSLYIEQLAELGLVGGVLLIGSIVAMLTALARRARGPERQVWAALFAGALTWAVHAGVDWDWEMPAVTAWFFAAGALALATPPERRPFESPPLLRFSVALGCLLLAVTPVTIWRSQTKLIGAVRAFERGDCLSAERDALASNAALPSRSDPFELIAYCEAGARRYALALNAIGAAERRDPQNWELRYSDAIISAAAGRDPRRAARAALVLYPASPLTQAAARAFGRGRARAWRRFAMTAPLPVSRSRR